MLNALIIAALAAGPAASAPYADCLLGNIQPGLTDRTLQLVQQACAAKHPDSFVAAMEMERQFGNQRRAQIDAERAAAERSANAAANAAAIAAQAAADREAERAKGADAK
ncbi:hypothetical protein C1925_15830 [Stenotrophomonas sp. SAU14A_NAIMI4_5]|uniref:hypothetical protein n=1 Tax=Stenotrophomonas sp. SAU14A_NAIMI4_5 TaxID=2072413 RepID=UPI000D53F1EC|nr:hypothetical protein [Stenotrophomonas sp. SAU14A_NAIMI4_5]AWH50517.1 hypothetical protein C1925_15830 [Stenotrophomonas sp. SAU14A_NAIMI4_5]